MTKKIDKSRFKVVVLCGGFEPESYASKLTGKNILRGLISAGYKQSKLVYVNKNIAKLLIKSKPDFAYLALFCKWGEDGVIQGLLETLDIPYSGPGLEASSVCKNKYLFGSFVNGIGLNSPTSYFYGDLRSFSKFDKKSLPYPVVIKPAYQGYSLGVSLVKNKHNLNSCVSKAFKFSSKICIQEYIEGRELTVGIIDLHDGSHKVLPIAEVKLKGRDIQDTEVKDHPELVEEICPAILTQNEQRKISETCLYLYEHLNCLGISRFDIRITNNEKIYFLENNTCPGLLNYEQSDIPKQLHAAGISMEEFVENQIINGLSRVDNKLEVKT